MLLTVPAASSSNLDEEGSAGTRERKRFEPEIDGKKTYKRNPKIKKTKDKIGVHKPGFEEKRQVLQLTAPATSSSNLDKDGFAAGRCQRKRGDDLVMMRE